MREWREATSTRQTANYTHFRHMFRCLTDINHIWLTDEEIATFGIKISPLNLDGGNTATVKGEPQYFAPLSSKEMNALPQLEFDLPPFEHGRGFTPPRTLAITILNHLVQELPEESWKSDTQDSLLSMSKWDKSPFRFAITMAGLWKYPMGNLDDYQWEKFGQLSTESLDHPHFILMSIHNLHPGRVEEQKLSKGEILVLLRMIMARIEDPRYVTHEIYPVLMVTIFDHKVRIVQAHFNEELRLQMSPFIDLADYSDEKKNLIMRWIMNEPVGDTLEIAKPSPKRSLVAQKAKALPPLDLGPRDYDRYL